MKPQMLADRGRGDDAAALESLFGKLRVSANWAIGFMSAIRSGPDPVTTEAWIRELVGDEALGDEATAHAWNGILTRLLGAVSETLRTSAETVPPEPDKPEEDVVDFCTGYLRGSAMHPTWRADATAMEKLAPFRVHAKEEGAPSVEAPRERLGHDVAELYGYWKAKRQVVNSAPKVGRNDPCPCGSGKKHKKCCAA